MKTPLQIHALVGRALDNAVENDYEDFALRASLQEVVEDLATLDSDLETCPLPVIRRGVKRWRAKHGITQNGTQVEEGQKWRDQDRRSNYRTVIITEVKNGYAYYGKGLNQRISILRMHRAWKLSA